MTELLTAAQMRAIEQAAIDSGQVTGLELMERAGQGVVDAVFAEWPELCEGEHRAVVLCGPGNNGGDGFVVARLLKDAGWEVEVFLYGDAEKLPPDAKVNYELWGEANAVIGLTQGFRPPPCDLLVDAVFGTGFARPFDEDLQFALADLARLNLPFKVVALDAPSGICLDSGKGIGMSLRADLTVTFHKKKCGHYLGLGARDCGHVALKDIGLSASRLYDIDALFAVTNDKTSQEHLGIDRQVAAMEASGQTVYLAECIDQKRLYKAVFDTIDPTRLSYQKYSHGHALILSGGVGKGGAARLAARGALRIGAGAVTVGAPPAALMENAAQLNAIMLRSIKDADALAEALEDTRINALCIGPGLGLAQESADLVDASLIIDRRIVLDADALTLLAQDATLFAKLHQNCILTPHAGEFARLFPDIAEKLEVPAAIGPAYSKVDATREAAKRAGCVVLFKGPDTVIADPSGGCSINASVYERSAPWLATAGSGDVLAGFITGLLARGFQPMQAAETGAYLHTECALSFGPGLIAEDLPDELPKVFRELGL